MSTVSQAGAGPLEVAPLPTSYPHERGNVVRLAFGSFLSGSLLTSYGWTTVLWLSFAPLLIAVAALATAAAVRPSRALG